MSPSCSARIAEVAAMFDVAFRKSDSEGDKLGDEEDEEVKDSSDSGSESEGPVEGDESHEIDDQSRELRDESHGLDNEGRGVERDILGLEEEAAPKGQQVSAFRQPALTTWTYPEDAPSVAPSPISSPLISLIVPSHVATLTATIPIDEDQFLERYQLRSLKHEQERAAMTFGALWRPVLALKAWAGRVDTQMASMSQAGYDDHRLVHDLLVQQATLQREL
ncbi:hypothetical protein Tco_1504854 [Tanacetum coccineum]